MTDDAIIEAAARAAYEHGTHPAAYTWDSADEAEREHARSFARAILAAVTPLILANERKEIANQARRYAGHYPEGSDGRNTFIVRATAASAGRERCR